MVASRTLENAEKLAHSFNGKTVPITNISDYLPQADVVVSATNCPVHFIDKNLVEHALQQKISPCSFWTYLYLGMLKTVLKN